MEMVEKEKSKSLTITVLVCANGLGHFKRVVGLSHEIIKRDTAFDLHLICSKWQVDRLKDWYKLQALIANNIQFHFGITEPGIQWNRNISLDHLNQWNQRLATLDCIKEADLVISDNLVEILAERPDTILLGSFLWFDIFKEAFPESTAVQQFVKHNLTLLEKHCPAMVCVDSIAMPSLKEYTRMRSVPWLGQEAKRIPSSSRSKKVAVLIGATNAAEVSMRKIVDILIRDTELEIALPQRSINAWELGNEAKIHPFNFGIDDFQACDLVLCRPGVGTITDCITANTPMLFFHEGNNAEMNYNEQQLINQGIALRLSFQFEATALLEMLNWYYESNFIEEAKQKLATIPVDGFEVAANWMLNKAILKQSK